MFRRAVKCHFLPSCRVVIALCIALLTSSEAVVDMKGFYRSVSGVCVYGEGIRVIKNN
jgi:hypothetical protein